MKEKEIWKDIPNYKGIYQISNLGRVKSLKRISRQGHLLNERILKPGGSKNSYVSVALHCKEKPRNNYSARIHRLVAEAFIPNPEGLTQVNHIDEDKRNNKASNLEWCTPRHNLLHSRKKNASSKYNGVYYVKAENVWRANCFFQGKLKHLGLFKNEEDAAQAYICFCAIHNLK